MTAKKGKKEKRFEGVKLVKNWLRAPQWVGGSGSRRGSGRKSKRQLAVGSKQTTFS